MTELNCRIPTGVWKVGELVGVRTEPTLSDTL